MLGDVEALPEVAAAGGTVFPPRPNAADILGPDGEAVAQESVGTEHDPANERFSPLELKTGDWPQRAAAGRVDAGTASKQHYAIGDTMASPTLGRTAAYRVTGTASYGTVDSLGFASIAVWDHATAQRLLDREGRYDSISIAAADGTTPDELVRAVGPVLPRGARGQGRRRAGGRGRRGDRTPASATSGCSCSASAASRCSSAPS